MKNKNSKNLNQTTHDDPLIFLEKIMSGFDPRKYSGLIELVNSIDEFFGDGDIPNKEWKELCNLVRTDYKHAIVCSKDSLRAATTLAEYKHSKRKSLEINGNLSSNDPNNSSLTEKEIKLFREKFNDEY